MREDADRTEEYQARDEELQSLRTEVEKYDLMIQNTQSSLSECQQSLEENMVGVEHYESMMNHTQSSLTKCRIQLESMIKEDADRTEEYKAKDDELQSLRRELELAEEELERRDIERAECDVLYRDLTKARVQNKGE
jgi:chromosome segregation ATPase